MNISLYHFLRAAASRKNGFGVLQDPMVACLYLEYKNNKSSSFIALVEFEIMISNRATAKSNNSSITVLSSKSSTFYANIKYTI